MLSPPLFHFPATGVYYKIRWEEDTGLWAVTTARLPRDNDKITPYQSGAAERNLEVKLRPPGKNVIESQFWFKPGVGYRTKSLRYSSHESGFQGHSDEAFYKDVEKYFDEHGQVKTQIDRRQREELRREGMKFLAASMLREIKHARAAIRPPQVGIEISVDETSDEINEEVERILKPLLDPQNQLNRSVVSMEDVYRCRSQDPADAFYCDPVNVRARHPNLTIVNEHFYLRPMAKDLKLEVLGECSHLGRPAVLVRGVPRITDEEEDAIFWVGWWGVPDDWWLVCDYYELAIDMESGLLLYYRGVVGSKTMVQSEMLELVFDPPEVMDESVFRGGQPTR
ncbi:MAG: hypothetical protein KatS3mg070_2582 [Meiothermus sp.]|nr:MAG: hypothetical protein KatS3mg070_2582 [Meiothermus sp.]